MPYFNWLGFTITGDKVSGLTFAPSTEYLDSQLLKRQIALVRSSQERPERLRARRFFARVKIADRYALLEQLNSMVAAGVLLPEALAIVAEQTRHLMLEEVMHMSALRVKEGELLSAVARDYPVFYDALMVQLLAVAEQSGKLSAILQTITHYLQAKQNFYGQVRAALLMPCMTLVFFLLVMIMLFLFVIPRFAQMFANIGQELPALTKFLIAVSSVMLSIQIIWVLLALGGICAGFAIVRKTDSWHKTKQRMLLAAPIVGSLVSDHIMGYFFESISLLLASGMPLLSALTAVKDTIVYPFFQERMDLVIREVKQGNSFAQALRVFDERIISADALAIIRVGQEIGSLDGMLKQVAAMYQARVKRTLSFLTMVIQPLLIVILGLLILLLIIAVYTPILQLSYAI
jgi:type II secretory pathway component PulF